MNETRTNTTRGTLLKRAALLAGAALGVGATARATAGETPAAATAAPLPRQRAERLTLAGRDWRLSRPGAEYGKLPDARVPAVPAGRIVDARGRDLGRFHAAALPGLTTFHLHTFELPEGTILGLGGSALGLGTYAIVGGTGRYSGASGTYTARQSPRELGGDGTAEFNLNLIAWEA